ncbi:MAG TPA: DUF2279 domain-containing protein [Gemmatimonadaceae bacterium]|nr:DUF2279 domain-containing protein [Gemmatimonadaceae bacterium]
MKPFIAIAFLFAGAGSVSAQASADTVSRIAAQPSSVFAVPSGRPDACPINGNQLGAVRAGIATAFVGGNAYLYHYFKNAWWSGERAEGFVWNADWDMEFRDQDKFGHMLGGYHLTRVGYAGLRTACVSKRKALIASATYAALFQLQIEIFDARFKKFGFSYPDLIANTAGQVLAVAQELNPRLEAVKPTFSYRQTRALKNKLPSSELRPSIDYSGQTYWFSTDVNRLLPEGAKPYWPSFIRLSAGHSITDWNDVTGAPIRAKRKILLSLDLDPGKLPGNAPLWRSIKSTLSYYRFPAPAIQITPSLDIVPWYR